MRLNITLKYDIEYWEGKYSVPGTRLGTFFQHFIEGSDDLFGVDIDDVVGRGHDHFMQATQWCEACAMIYIFTIEPNERGVGT
jgi:hypothetical protein